jgi:transposase-like protein
MDNSTPYLSTICTGNTYRLKLRQAIITEVFSTPRNLPTMAQKFSVQAKLIAKWKQKFQEKSAIGFLNSTVGTEINNVSQEQQRDSIQLLVVGLGEVVGIVC